LPDPGRIGVLITRPEPGAAATAARVATLGLRPVVAPLLEIHSLPLALPQADRLQAVLIASGNAIAGLPASYRPLKLLAVGDASADRARAAGFTQVLSADGDAEALAALTNAQCDPAGLPLLLAAGRGQSLALAATLRVRGFRVIRRATYAAIPARSMPPDAVVALREKSLRAALFFSGETAHLFVSLLVNSGLREAVHGIDACAIGAAAATAIETLPWRRVLCAAKPTQDAMLALLR
jgi:uroporphyrinogen-III synthase